MKTQKNQVRSRSLLTLSRMLVFFLSLYTPAAFASAPSYCLAGQLHVPNQGGQTSNSLSLSQDGVILENDGTQLVWRDNGNLEIQYYETQVLWSSDTGGRGKRLFFDANGPGEGRLVIQDVLGKEIWSSGTQAGYRLQLYVNRNLVLLTGTGQQIWQSKTTMPVLDKDQLNLINQSGQEALDYRVPTTNSTKYVTIVAEGADGGKRQVKESNGNTRFTVKGGSGATIKATFEIGTGQDQIPPGAVLRVIVGEKGSTTTSQEAAGSGGGAGTAVLLKRPGKLAWTLLMVAGGGGGAYSNCCGDKHEGFSAEVGTGGGRGSQTVSANTAGQDGHSADASYGGGGAFLHGYVSDESGQELGWPGGATNTSKLPTGGKWTYSSGEVGSSWGFGAGGSRGRFGVISLAEAGGGGGYSGGAKGSGGGGGAGGGGSYMTSDMAVSQVEMIKNPTTSNTQDGYVSIQFTNTLGTRVKMLKLSAAPNKCIDNTGGKFDNDNNIQLYDCKPEWRSPYWVFEDAKLHQGYHNQKCIDVKNHGTENGTNIRLWTCMEHDEQRWIYDGLTQQLRSYLDINKCLDDAFNGRTTNGNNIQLWDCKPSNQGGMGQQWTISNASLISNPTSIQYIVPTKYDNRALQSINGAKMNSNIQLGAKSSTNSNLKWFFDGQQIKYGPSRDLCLGLEDNKTAAGTNVQLKGSSSDSNTRKWIYDGMTKQIRSAADPKKCLEVETTGSYDVGSNLKLMACDDLRRQQFAIVDK